MRITRLVVRNFRNLADIDISMVPGAVVVGENRSGKSNDIGRYLDTTRAELVFARAVLLVEGFGEEVLLPTMADQLGMDLDNPTRETSTAAQCLDAHTPPLCRVGCGLCRVGCGQYISDRKSSAGRFSPR
jgi:hypothetical protein